MLHNSSLPDQPDSNLSTSSCGSDSETSSGPLKWSSTPINERRNLANQNQISEIGSHEALSVESDNSDENFEIINNSEDSLKALILTDDLNVKADVFTPNKDNQAWCEATIPAGKRYLICANVVSSSQVVIEFTTSPQV